MCLNVEFDIANSKDFGSVGAVMGGGRANARLEVGEGGKPSSVVGDVDI